MIYLRLREIGTVAALAFAFAACGSNGSDNDDDDDDRGQAGEDAGPGASGSPGTGATGGTGGTSGSDGSGGSGDASSGGSSAAGKGGGSGSGTGGSMSGNTDELLDIIEGHCEADCDAQYALDCAPVNSNRLVCETSCVAATAQVGDFCLAEYAALVECKSQGGYECLQDYPYPRSTCAGESLAFSECAKDIGCKRYCDRLVDEQCGDVSFDDCLTQCFAEEAALPDDCEPYYDGVPYCQATMANVTCVEGKLTTPETCSYSVMSVAECIGEDATNYCEGFCWAADRLGCGGEDCAADCAAKSSDETCGAAWLDMLDCAMFFGDAACVDGAFMGNSICDSEAQAYAACVNPPAEP